MILKITCFKYHVSQIWPLKILNEYFWKIWVLKSTIQRHETYSFFTQNLKKQRKGLDPVSSPFNCITDYNVLDMLYSVNIFELSTLTTIVVLQARSIYEIKNNVDISENTNARIKHGRRRRHLRGVPKSARGVTRFHVCNE